MYSSTFRKKATALLVAILAYSLIFPAYIFALPQGAQVVAGQADITNPSAQAMQINQATQKAIINWQQFSIAAPEAVNFTQPNAAAIALNRVVGVDPSLIYGSLTANGGVWVINPAGVLVGSTGIINVNSFLASTLDIANEDFLSGNYTFTQRLNESLASIVNQGTISAASGGSVSLIAPGIVNQGTIVASLGKVNLGAGEQVTLNFQGNELINFAVDKSVLGEVLGPDGQPLEDSILNEGTISAEGGEIVLSARTAYDAIKSVVNNKGVIEAQTVENDNGVIRLQGNDLGIVYNSGTLDVSGLDEGETGGEVEVTGEKVGLVHYSKIKASGRRGGGKVLVGGDFQGKNPKIVNAKRTYVGKDATIEADAIDEGDGGRVIIWADESTGFYGDVSANGGNFSGAGGFIEISGKQSLSFNGVVDALAPNGKIGTVLFDPTNILIDSAGGGGDTATGTAAGQILYGDTPGVDPWDVTPAQLVAVDADIILEAHLDITLAASSDLSLNTTRSLTMRAGDDITINSNITTTGSGASITLIANDVGATPTGADGTADITINGNITSNGNNVIITIENTATGHHPTGTGAYSQGDFDITAGAGNITITADAVAFAANTGSNALQTSAGAVTLKPTQAGTTMSLGGGSTFDLTAAEIVDIAGGVSGTGTIVIGDSAASTAAMTLAGGAPLNFGSQDVMLHAGSFTDGDTTLNVLTASTLRLNARTGAIGATGSNNAIDIAVTDLEVDTAGGDAFITSAGGYNIVAPSSVGAGQLDLKVTTAGSITHTGGADITAGTLTVDNQVGATTLDQNNVVSGLGAMTNTGGTFSMTNTAELTLNDAIDATGQTFTISNGANAVIFGAGVTSVTASTFTVEAADVDTFDNVGALTADTVLAPNATTGTIDLAVGDGATFTLTAAEIGKLKAGTGTVTIGQTGQTGALTLGADVDLAGKTVTINSGRVTEVGTDEIIANNLTLDIGTASSVGASAVRTTANVLAIDTTDGFDATDRSIMVVDTTAGALSLGIINLNDGGIDLTSSSSAVTQAGIMTAGGGLMYSNASGTTTLGQNNVVSGLGAMTSTAGAFSMTNTAELTLTDAIDATGQTFTISNGANAVIFALDGATENITASTFTVRASDVDDLNTVGSFGTTNVVLEPNATTDTIGLAGTNDALATFTLVNDDLTELNTNAGTVTIGQTGQTGALSLGGAVGLGNRTVVINSGLVNDSTNAIAADSLSLDIGTASAVGASTIRTTANTLAINTTDGFNATDRGITVVDTAGVALGVVNVNDGTFSLTASGDVTQGAAITAQNLLLSVTGNTTLDQANNITNLGLSNFSGGTVTITNNGNLVISDDVTIADGSGAVLIDVGSNDLTVGDGTLFDTLDHGNNSLTLALQDLNFNSGEIVGTGNFGLTLSGTTIGLGVDGGQDFVLTGTDLQNITADQYTIGGNTITAITVDNISAANSNNIGTLVLDATGVGGQITFENNASTFNALTANANAGITVERTITTDTGALILNSDADLNNGGTDIIAIGDAGTTVNLISEGALTLRTATNGVNLAGNTGTTVTFDADSDALVSITRASDASATPITTTNAPSLTINSEGGITVGSVDLSSGTFTAHVDNNDSGGGATGSFGALQAGQITVDGTSSDDTLNFTSTVESTVGLVTISQANIVDLDGDVTAETGLTISNVNTEIDMAADVDLLAEAGNLAANTGVTAIDLSGAGTNLITATAGSLNLAAVTDSANIAEFEINAGTDITLAGVELDNGGTSLFDINMDTVGGAARTLDINGDVDVVSLTVDGAGGNDIVTLGADTDITTSTSGISMAAANNIVGITLDGVGSNVITSAAAVDLAAVTDSANIAELEVNAGTDITLAAVTLNNGGASLLDINLDTGANGAQTLNANGAINVGSLTANGQGINDTLNFGSTVTSTVAGIAIDTANVVDFDADVLAANGLTIQNVNTRVDLGAGVDLEATLGDLAVNTGVTAIDLSGAGTNLITATAGSVDLAAVTDSAAIAELEVNAGTDITLAAVTLNNGGASLLDINLDTGVNGGQTLNANGAINVGSLTANGQGINDTLNFGSTVTSTAAGIAIDTANVVDFDADVLAANGLTIQNVNTWVDLAAGVDLTATLGDLAVNTGVTAIDLSGAGTNLITATAGSVNLAAVTDSANIAELEVNAGTDITLAAVTINDGGASLLDINLDTGVNGAQTLNVNGAINVSSLTANAQGTGDTLNFGTTVTSTVAGIAVDTANVVDFDADVVAATDLVIQNVSTRVDLGAGVDLTSNNGLLSAFSNVALINLSGGGTNVIQSDGDALINLGPITASANENLTVTSQGGVTFAGSVDINNGTLAVTADDNNNGTETLLASSTLDAGVITLSGDGTTNDDVIDLDNTVISSTGAILMQDAATVDSANTIRAATTLTIRDITGAITLGDLQTTNGSIDITADGSITALNVTSLTDNALNDIDITSNAGGIVAGTINAGTLGDVNLDAPGAGGAITDTAGKISANKLTANANGAMTWILPLIL